MRCSAENTCSDVSSVGGQRATGARGSFFRVGMASVSRIHSPPATRELGGLLPLVRRYRGAWHRILSLVRMKTDMAAASICPLAEE